MFATRRAAATVAALISLSAVALATSAPASAAHDVTPPVVKTNVYASFVVGSTINAVVPGSQDDLTTRVEQRMKYTISDDSGRICSITIHRLSYESQTEPESHSPVVYEDIVILPTPYTSSIVVTNNDDDGQLGDVEDTTVGWSIHATDCTGNSGAVRVYSNPVVVQQDGYSWAYDYGTVASRGTWKTVTCACASGGTMTMTTARNASISYTDTYAENGEHMAIVMAKGPARGSAAIYVDGVRRRTVDTYAPANTNRVVVFEQAMPAGRHVVKVVNLATAGHPRIDVDAFMTN